MQATDIQNIIEPCVNDRGFELVGVERSGTGRYARLAVFLDKEGGITLDDISSVTPQLMSELRVAGFDVDNMNVEVSSPGLARPLFTLAHYERFIGKEVKIQLHVPMNGQRQWVGVIQAVNGETIVLAVDKETVNFTLGDIARAKLIPVFK